MGSPRLRSVLRDPRATRGRWRASRRLSSRIPAFVAAILARHARGAAAVFGPDRVPRRPYAFAGPTHHHYHGGRGTSLAIRVEIGLVLAMRSRTRSAPFLPWIAAAERNGASEGEGAAGPLVERIVSRERRIETSVTMREVLRDAVARQSGGEAMAMVARPRARPVEMVVHGPRVPPADAGRSGAAEPQRAEAGERAAWPSLVRPIAISAPAPIGAAELGRVTEHVLRAIDRRVLAQRERRGRV